MTVVRPGNDQATPCRATLAPPDLLPTQRRPPTASSRPYDVLCLWVLSTSLFLIATSPAFAQAHSLEVSQYLHTSWTAQEGFFRGGISSIAQTSDGYLWVVSPTGGLFRFDGVRFTEWKPPGNET